MLLNTLGMTSFGDRLRTLRETLQGVDPVNYSLRQVAKRVGISPTYLSRLETEKEDAMPSEEHILALAEEVGEDPDVLLALAGRVSERHLEIFRKHPREFAALIQKLKRASGETILKAAQVRDGKW